MTSINNQIIVVGGGAAGMIAAFYASDRCKNVVIIEKNKMLGRKLRITGKGRCNITNAADISDFFGCIPVNANFLYSALYSYTNEDIVALLNSLGVATKVERGGRVFPLSDNANQVADALADALRKKKVRVIRDEVVDIVADDHQVYGVKLKSGRKLDGKVILATGGASYPLTGSDGFGFKLAKSLGHNVTELKPSLVPVECDDKWIRDISGLSLKNVSLTVLRGKQLIYSEQGEMLFTHFGVSGPLVLSASSHMRRISPGEYKMYVDLKPALDEDKLDKRILRDFEGELNKDICNGLDKLLPKSLIPVILDIASIDWRKKINTVTKQERMELVRVIKSLPVNPVRFRPIAEAIITSGGINIKEINPSTMESKIIKDLYFAGEIIDTDAYTGGYNLQIAWSTGYLAGMNASDNF